MAIQDLIASLSVNPQQGNRSYLLERIKRYLEHHRDAVEEYRAKIPFVDSELSTALQRIVAQYDQVSNFYANQLVDPGN